MKQSKQELQRITNILFPKEIDKHSKENISQNFNTKHQISKFKKQIDNINCDEIIIDQCNKTSRYYFEKIKTIANRLDNKKYANQINQGCKYLIQSIPIRNKFPELFIQKYNYQRLSILLQFLQNFMKKKYQFIKMNVFCQLLQNIPKDNIQKQQIKYKIKLKLNQLTLIQKKAVFNQWRYATHFNQDNNNKLQERQHLSEILKYITNQAKLLNYLQNKFKHNPTQILLYNSQLNTLRGYYLEQDFKLNNCTSFQSLSSNSLSHQYRNKYKIIDDDTIINSTIKKYQFNLQEHSLTYQCIHRKKVICAQGFCNGSRGDNLWNCQSNRYQGIIIYPIISSQKIIGILRQYYYDKINQNQFIQKQKLQNLQSIGNIIQSSIKITQRLKNMHRQSQYINKKYYQKIISIIQKINQVQISSNILYKLNQLLDQYFNITHMEIFQIQNNNSQEQLLKQIYGLKNKKNIIDQYQYNNHLIPGLSILKDNYLNYIQSQDHILFIVNQNLYNFTIKKNLQQNNNLSSLLPLSSLQQSTSFPLNLIHELLIKCQQLISIKSKKQEILRKEQQKIIMINQIIQDNKQYQMFQKNIIKLYSNKFDQEFSGRNLWKFCKSSNLKGQWDIIVNVKWGQECLSYKIWQGMLVKNNEYKKLNYCEVIYQYHNNNQILRIQLQSEEKISQKIQQAAIDYLNKQLNEYINENISQQITQRLKLQYLLNQDNGFNPQTKLKLIIQNLFQCQCTFVQGQFQFYQSYQNYTNFPKNCHQILMGFLRFSLRQQFPNKICSQKQIQSGLQQYISKFTTQYTYVILNHKKAIIFNKSIHLNSQTIKQIQQLYKRQIESKMLDVHYHCLYQNKINVYQIINILDNYINRYLKNCFSKLIKTLEKQYNLSIIQKVNLIYKNIISGCFMKIKRNSQLQCCKLYNTKKFMNLINIFIMKHSDQPLAFQKIKYHQSSIKQQSALIKIQYFFNIKQQKFIKAAYQQIYYKSKLFSKASLLKYLEIGLQNLRYSFNILKKISKQKQIMKKQSIFTQISRSQNFKNLFKYLKQSYPQYQLAYKIFNQFYLLSNTLNIIRQQQLINLYNNYSTYQSLQKNSKIIWYSKDKLQFTVAIKNQLTIISKGIIQSFKKIIILKKPKIYFLNNFYNYQLITKKKYYFQQWKKIMIQFSKIQKYQKKQKIYHLNMQGQTLKEKIKIKNNQNQENINIANRMEAKIKDLQDKSQQLKKKILKIQISSQEIENTCLIMKNRNLSQISYYYFKKWRLNAQQQTKDKFQLNKFIKIGLKNLKNILQKKLKQLMTSGIKSLTIRSIHSYHQYQKSKQNNCYLKQLGSYPCGRLLTFQNDLSSQSNKKSDSREFIQDRNQDLDYYFKQQSQKLDNKQNLSQNYDITEQDINKVNKDGYKLNHKTIKFLKRMGKLQKI